MRQSLGATRRNLTSVGRSATFPCVEVNYQSLLHIMRLNMCLKNVLVFALDYGVFTRSVFEISNIIISISDSRLLENVFSNKALTIIKQ